MNVAPSEISHVSRASQQVLDNVSRKSESRLFKLEAQVNQNMINSAWSALGAYLSKNIRMGRAVVIPKLGVISFGSPNVKLEGVTNPEQRDVRLRRPVFLINKEFVKGMNISAGVVNGGIIRPYSMKGVVSGVGQTKINYTEIGIYAGIDKDNAKVCIERVIKELSEKTKSGQNVEMDIPNLGTFLIRNQVAAISFDDYLVSDALDATNKFVKEKKVITGPSSLTAKNLDEFLKQTDRNDPNGEKTAIEIDKSAQNWLKEKLDIDVEDLKAISRPRTANSIKVKQNGMIFSQKYTGLKELTGENLPQYSKDRPTTAVSNRLPSREEPNRDAFNFVLLESAKKKLKMWIRAKSLLPEDAFYELATYAIGPAASIDCKLSLEDVKRGFTKAIGLSLSAMEAEAIFQSLDKNSIGFIDFAKWKAEFPDEKSYLNYMRDVITKYNLQTDDILRRMELTRYSNAMNAEDLGKAITLLDPSLDNVKSLKIATSVLKGKEKITIKELIDVFGCPADDNHEASDWFNSELIKIKKAVVDPKLLREKFESHDTKNRGLLDPASFKTALLKSGIGLNLNEINRLTRYIEKDAAFQIDYLKFIETVEKVKTDDDIKLITSSFAHLELEQFNVIREKLHKYISEKGIKPERIIRKIYENKYGDNSGPKLLSLEDFSEFLFGLVRPMVRGQEACLSFAKKIDINHDNFIDDTDFNTFLNRDGYIGEAEKQGTRTNFYQTTTSTNSVPTNSELFPKVPLTEEKVDVVLRDLKQALNDKGISFYDFVRSLDLNEVGFITVNDFSVGLDKVLKLSPPTKDGLFAYIDKRRMGMISYDEILKILKRGVLESRVDLSEDNFDWQENLIKLIKQYVKEKNLTVEDVFRIADADFDGAVSRKDLNHFVREALKVPADEVNATRIERLFKLIDVFKRNSLQLSDFKRLIQDDFEKGNNVVVSGGKQLMGTSTFSWKIHARQQLGLLLSKDFSDLKASFEEISGHSVKMTYKSFAEWIAKSRALAGFDLTDKLLQVLFADLDPHKKGYLTELDWTNAFGAYSFKNQVISEVQEALNANYNDIQSAFESFLSHEQEINKSAKDITFQGFYKAINSLIPNRFDTNEIDFMWKKCSGGAEVVGLAKFQNGFDNKKFTGSRYVSTNKILTTSQFTRKTNNFTDKFNPASTAKVEVHVSKEEKQKKLFDKLRQIILASNTPVEKFFKSIDTDGSGQVSNLEFINAIRGLNIGLNLKEIEDLIMYCDTNGDGMISFQEFVQKFAPDDADGRLFDRSKNKIKKLKENIYAYMLSPKDAFLTFNEDRTGRLTYEQFNKMIIKLFQLAREDTPSFPLIKDMFDFIDMRRDGIIDMNEWMQSFRLIESGNIGVSSSENTFTKRNAGVNVGSLTKVHFPAVKAFASPKGDVDGSNVALNVSGWECSKEYENVLKTIGKNRKLLTSLFDNLKNTGVAITKEKAREVIANILENSKIQLTPEKWPYLLKFAEKDGVIDYKFLLEIFKERLYLLSAHPKVSVGTL